MGKCAVHFGGGKKNPVLAKAIMSSVIKKLKFREQKCKWEKCETDYIIE